MNSKLDQLIFRAEPVEKADMICSVSGKKKIEKNLLEEEVCPSSPNLFTALKELDNDITLNAKQKTSVLSTSEEETKLIAKNIATTLRPGSILALHGDLGAGKTIFAKGLIPVLSGLNESSIQSPTFTYLHVFDTTPPIYHFDLYRIKNAYAFLEMGFLDYFDGKGICLIEWPERINALLPPHTIHIEIFHMEGEKRQIDVR